MIKPSRMKKLSAVVLEEKKDAVLRELKERGVIHFVKVDAEGDAENYIDPCKTQGINVEAGEYLSKIEGILDVLNLASDGEKPLIKKLTEKQVRPVETREISPSELFKSAGEKLSGIDERTSEISSRLEKLKKGEEEISEAKEIMAKLRLLGLGPVDIQELRFTFIATGVIPSEEVLTLKGEIGKITDLFSVHSAKLDKDGSIVLLIAWKDVEVEIRRALHIHRFEEFCVPGSFFGLSQKEALSYIEKRLSGIKEEEEGLLTEIKKLKDAEMRGLLIMRESIQIEKLVDEANVFFGSTKSTFLFEGWVPADRADEAARVIDRASEGHAIIKVKDPARGEHPPTLLKNSPIAKPMELLTKTYGIPTYGKIDPSFLMSISFPLLFGLMFGDVGQGAVLAILGYIMGFRLTLDETVKRLGKILFLCGIAATLSGFLYGEVFGLELLHPLWLRPMESVMTIIVFSFYIALAQLSLGCFVNIANELSQGKPLRAIFGPWGVMGLWLYWGGFTLFLRIGVDGVFNALFGFFDAAQILSSLKIIGPPIIFPLVMIAIGTRHTEGLSLPWSIYEAYEAHTRFLFNSISYVRIGALAIVHAVFASVMVMGMNAAPSPLNILILIFGNIAIIIFETLISFIQSLRLHYYEWFSKFYDGEGDSFGAFKAVRKYTFLLPAEAEGKQ